MTSLFFFPTGLFLADCRAWQADFQRGILAIQEFYAQRDGDSPMFEQLMLECMKQ